MIESAFPGGSGGGVETVTAGTGIAVDNTDPANPVVSSTVVAPVTSVNSKTGAVTLTNTDVGAAATSHTHAASNITSGVLATARLASSGTASSTTYLRGDQTWSPIAAGPTFYTVTANDVENTTTETTALSWTVPANTWSNGQSLVLEWFVEVSNGTGSIANFNYKFGGTGITELSATNGIVQNMAGYKAFRHMRIFIVREGNGVLYPAPNTSMSGYSWVSMSLNPLASTTIQALEFDNRFAVDSSVDFTTNITFTLKVSFATAAATLYLRNRFATVYKIDGTP